MKGQVTTLGPWTVDDSTLVKFECECGEKLEFRLEDVEQGFAFRYMAPWACSCGIEHQSLMDARTKHSSSIHHGSVAEAPSENAWLPLFSFDVVAHEVKTGTPLATVKPAGFLTLKGYVPLPSSCPCCGSSRVEETSSSYDTNAFYEADWRCVDCWNKWSIGPKAEGKAPLTLIALEGRKDARGQRTVNGR